MSSGVLDLYEFGPFRLDVQRRVLTHGDQVVPLPPKTFELLVLLVHSEGRAVPKQELMAALWPDTFVEEANLSFQISTLRKALGDTDSHWIETLPKHGYRFGADVKAISSEDHDAAQEFAAAEGASARSERRGTWTRTKWASAAFVVLLLSVLSYISTFKKQPTEAVKIAGSPAMPLTAYKGFENAPSLSPDGSQVAFSWNGPQQDNYDIYLKLVGPGPPRQLTTDPARDDNPAWSPDGLLIAFERFTTADTADVYVIPALGGAEKKVATNLWSQSRMESHSESNGRLRWSADGKWLAHLGGPSQPGIWLFAADGSGTRQLTERGYAPAFSPNGQQLAFVRLAAALPAVYILPLSTGLVPAATARQVTPEYPFIRGLAWTPDGDALVYAASGHMGLSHLYRIALASNRLEPNGQPEPLTFGENASAVTISRTGRLVYSAQVRDSNIWKLSLTGTDRLKNGPLVSENFDDETPDYSPDGTQLAFASTRSGSEEIWVANADGSNPVQRTTMGGPVCSGPRWSPDGRKILFHSSSRQSARALYLLEMQSGQTHQLTDQRTWDSQASWSRSGRFIYFESNRAARTGRREIWRMSADGGNPTQVTTQGGSMAMESPDGRFLYYAKAAPPLPIAIWRVPVGGGEERFIVGGLSDTLNFAVAKEGLYFLAVGDAQNKTSIDFFEFKTGRRSTLLRVDKFWWYGMALSPDQQSLLYSVVDSAGSNLMLVDKVQ